MEEYFKKGDEIGLEKYLDEVVDLKNSFKFKNFCIKILIKLFYKNVDLILANTKESAYDWSKISGKKVINIYNK